MADDFSNDSNSSGRIAPGSPARGTLDYSGDHDWFKAWLSADQYYSLLTYAPYANVAVRDASGALLANFGFSAVHLYLSGAYTPPADGYYYLDFSGWPGAYTLTLQSRPLKDDIGNTAQDATPLALGQTLAATLNGPLDGDVLALPVKAGVSYAMQFTGGSDSLGVTASGWQGTPNGGTANYSLRGNASSFTAACDGTVYFTVQQRGYQADQAQTDLPFTVTASLAPDDFGASAATAGRLAVGANIQGQLDPGGGDRDWIGAELKAGQTYWFALGGDAALAPDLPSGLDISILDPSGYAVERAYLRDSFDAPLLAVTPHADGTYYFTLAPMVQGSGAYQLSLQLAGQDDVPAATPAALPDNVARRGTIEVQGDNDVYSFDSVAGHSYEVLVLGNAAPYASVRRADGNVYTEQERGEHSHVLRVPSAPGGKLLLDIDGSALPAGSRYDVRVRDLGLDDAPDLSGGSGALAPNSSVRGVLEGALDRDNFRVHVEAGQTYHFALHGAASGGGSLASDWPGALLLSDQYLAGILAAADGGSEGTLDFTASRSADLLLSVLSRGGASGSYTLSAQTLTGDTAAPQLTAAPSAHPGLAHSLQLQFNEAVKLAPGALRLLNADGSAYAIGDVLQVSVLHNTITIDPQRLLQPGAAYRLELAPGALRDLAGNAYSGPTSWLISTVPASPSATAGDDLLLGSQAGGSALDGGAGSDIVYYARNREAYSISRSADGISVQPAGAASADRLQAVERVWFNNQALAFDSDGAAGQVLRLYQAAFDRQPDQVGMGFWLYQREHGMDLPSIAQHFVASAEFQSRYGLASSNAEFVDLLYANVLHRQGEAGGVAFWNQVLDGGYPRAGVLAAFAESPENVAATAWLMAEGTPYQPW